MTEEQLEDRKRDAAILKATKEMLSDAKKFAAKKKNKKVEKLIDNAIGETNGQSAAMGFSESDLRNASYREPSQEAVESYNRRMEKRKQQTSSISSVGVTDYGMLPDIDEAPVENNVKVNASYGTVEEKPQQPFMGEPYSIEDKPKPVRYDKENPYGANAVDMSKFDNRYGSDMPEYPRPAEAPVHPKQEEVSVPSDGYDLGLIADIPSDVQYDMIPLPSDGQCYPDKKDKLPVSYLTAADENIITSPNMYRDGKILDVILRRKILDKHVDVNKLCRGDRDALVIWLRATGYGPQFPISVRDPETGVEFETVVDLTRIRKKPFKLKGDERGWFDYKTERGDELKFKFIDRNDEIVLSEWNKRDNASMRVLRIANIISDINDEMNNDRSLSEVDRQRIGKAVNVLNGWINLTKQDDGDEEYGRGITNTMFLMIMSVNGNTDREFIRKYVQNMPAADAFAFRRYVTKNEPGMDMNIRVERPANLGGGSFDTFLAIDASIFINIS